MTSESLNGAGDAIKLISAHHASCKFLASPRTAVVLAVAPRNDSWPNCPKTVPSDAPCQGIRLPDRLFRIDPAECCTAPTFGHNWSKQPSSLQDARRGCLRVQRITHGRAWFGFSALRRDCVRQAAESLCCGAAWDIRPCPSVCCELMIRIDFCLHSARETDLSFHAGLVLSFTRENLRMCTKTWRFRSAARNTFPWMG